VIRDLQGDYSARDQREARNISKNPEIRVGNLCRLEPPANLSIAFRPPFCCTPLFELPV